MNSHKLQRFVRNRCCTLLGVGPVSRNCVDAAIDIANNHAVPIILIASRRQIESEEFGGGYVGNWSTDRFAAYVFDKDKRGKICLARDHGGPWQHPREVEGTLSLRQAMESAKRSYQADIESGFELIHIDPSVDIHATPHVDEILDRVYELYEFCYRVAQENKREIHFEVGTDEQGESLQQDLDEFEYVLAEITQFCEREKLPKPMFVVAQTGTKVMESRNIGSFDSPYRIKNELPVEIQLPQIISLCDKYGIWLKEHNTDYLSDESLRWHPKLGVHAANVAPEFGVVETRAWMRLLREAGLEQLEHRFIDLAHGSGKWKKWVFPDTALDARGKAELCGHYVFADPRFAELKSEAQRGLNSKGIVVDDVLKDAVKTAIFRYVKHFNLLETFP